MSSFNYSEKLYESSSQISIESISAIYQEEIEEIGIAAEKQQLSQYFEDYLEQTNINIEVIQEIVITKQKPNFIFFFIRKSRKSRHLSNKQLKSLSFQLKLQRSEQQLLMDPWNRTTHYPCCRGCCTNEQKENDFFAQKMIQVTQLKEAEETVSSLNFNSNQYNISTNNDLVDKLCKKIMKIEESQHQYIQPYLQNQQQNKLQ